MNLFLCGGQNILWKTIIHTCEYGSLRIDGRVSQKKKKMLCRNMWFLLSLLGCKINRNCKAKLRNKRKGRAQTDRKQSMLPISLSRTLAECGMLKKGIGD
jgi:hypothetical protein